MSDAFTQLRYHIVFSTKDRQRLLTAELRPRLFSYLSGIARKKNAVVLGVGGIADHIHILLRAAPSVAPSDLVASLKANSSRWLNRSGLVHGRFAWQVGYAAFSVSSSQISAVQRYIRRQEEHHRRMSSQEEWRLLLERNGLSEATSGLDERRESSPAPGGGHT